MEFALQLRDIDIRQLVRDAIRESRDPGRVALVTSADALMIRGDEDRLQHALASTPVCARRRRRHRARALPLAGSSFC